MIKKQRLDYLDNLKILLTLLVIVHHIAIAFGGEGAFIIASKTDSSEIFSLAMTGFLAINQSYFMGLFFAVSAYFSYKSLKKKGRQAFIKSKVKRLLIPALIYFFVLSPINIVIVDIFQKGKFISDLSLRFGIGALWFVLALFIFDLLYAYISPILKSVKIKHLFFISPLIVILIWLIRIFMPVGWFIPILAFQPAHFGQYIFAYVLGIVVSRDDLLTFMEANKYYLILLCVLPIIVLLGLVIYNLITNVGDITLAFGGMNLYALLYSLFDMLMFMTMSIGLTSLFQHFFNRKNTLTTYLTNYAFGAYAMHYLAVSLCIITLNMFNLSHIVTFMMTILLGVSLSFVMGKWFKPVFG